MLDLRKSSINSGLCKVLSEVLKRFYCPLEVMLTCVRRYVAYPLCLRHVEKMMRERGVFVAHDCALLGNQDGAGAGRRISSAQAPRWQKFADGLPRRSTHVRSAAVLQPCCSISNSATQLF